MQLTKNFNSKEFACKDGTAVPASLMINVKKLAENLQVLRDYLGKPIVINSGYRTPIYNKKIGGATSSQHLEAKAGDIRVEGMMPKEIHAAILKLISDKKMHNGGLGLYSSFVHYDVRTTPSRWNG